MPIDKTQWHAELMLDFDTNGTKTVLSSRKQRGPLAVQRPLYPEGEVCHIYMLHPPGGVVGGDRLDINIAVAARASALLTTPGATKFYRSNGRLAQQQQSFHVDGCLEWLPQENIFFPTARVQLSTDIHLGADARYIGWDIQCLGRPVINERFGQGNLLFTNRLYRAGKPLFIDRLAINDHSQLNAAAGLRGHPVVATLLATPADTTTLERARTHCETALAQGTGAATLLNDVLIVRYLGSSTAEAHGLLRSAWHSIRPLITGRPAVPPRIWNT